MSGTSFLVEPLSSICTFKYLFNSEQIYLKYNFNECIEWETRIDKRDICWNEVSYLMPRISDSFMKGIIQASVPGGKTSRRVQR